ncbi:MAG TPA: prepilin-type N-terminal cleavage/methylation domain-containing protein [Desulfosarcina sp.]|nr:prepilin-type N-terminal cleavage/methylation domain-containing protein [Desulfosarcina sp.]
MRRINMGASAHGGTTPGAQRRAAAGGFTLLEVMVAMFLFFMAVFAILDVTNQSLRAARGLQAKVPDVSALAADLYLTNRLEEGVESGDFGELYPEFQWTRTIFERETNGLFQVDFTISGTVAGRSIITTNSLLLWRPDSARPSAGLGSRR